MTRTERTLAMTKGAEKAPPSPNANPSDSNPSPPSPNANPRDFHPHRTASDELFLSSLQTSHNPSSLRKPHTPRLCEEQSDAAIHLSFLGNPSPLIIAKTPRTSSLRGAKRRGNPPSSVPVIKKRWIAALRSQ